MSSIFVPLVKKYRTSREKVSYLSWKSIVPLVKKYRTFNKKKARKIAFFDTQ